MVGRTLAEQARTLAEQARQKNAMLWQPPPWWPLSKKLAPQRQQAVTLCMQESASSCLA